MKLYEKKQVNTLFLKMISENTLKSEKNVNFHL